jgi:cyclic pyranopterin phosphate synthase
MRSLPVVASSVSRSAVHEHLPSMPDGFEPPSYLGDAHGRRYEYLRLSVTDRCDLACRYCMPPSGEDDHALRPDLLSFEEIARLASIVAERGIRRLRFTGGEPLVRKDFVRLVELVRRRAAIEEIVFTTNATRLAELARPLRDAGVDGVNVSIDSLDADRFRDITRGGDLGRVLAGIHAAIDVGFEVKLNCVLLRGVNHEEAGALVDFAWDLGVVPRFIELMPLGEGAALPADTFVSSAEVVELLGDRVSRGERRRSSGVRGPAGYLHASDGSGRRVGFITAISESFCSDCNRIRVTARGDLRPCLASRRAISVRDEFRRGATDLEVLWALHWALRGKGDGHAFLDPDVKEHEYVGMSLVGG